MAKKTKKKKNDDRAIYFPRLLHTQLKSLAAGKDKKLGEFCAERLWPLVEDRNGKAATK